MTIFFRKSFNKKVSPPLLKYVPIFIDTFPDGVKFCASQRILYCDKNSPAGPLGIILIQLVFMWALYQ